MSAPPLLLTLKAIIERSYGMATIIDDLAPYIIGDAGYRLRFGTGPGDLSPLPRARLLVRDGGPGVRAALYYPDSLVRHLERFNPLAGVDDVNIEAFAVLVEELDHLLTIASRSAEQRPISLLELEHHANVTKCLVVLHFLARQTGRRRVSAPLRGWVRHHLLGRFATAVGEDGERYRSAARMAGTYLDYLDSLPPAERPAELQAYQRRPFSETLRLVMNPN